jgi:hypothetical protein
MNYLTVGVIAIAALACEESVYGAQTPLTTTGFNQDFVIEAGIPVNASSFQGAVSATTDAGTGHTGNTFYAIGEDVDAPTTGLAH